MKLLITLRKISDNSFRKEFEFTEFPLNIGRENDNEIILEDHRKIVSRSHARIVNNNGFIRIADLGSANFTYLNGIKLFPNDENNLKTGDVIKIGDYELEVKIEKFNPLSDFDDQKTMVFSNPFYDEVIKISEAIEKLSEKYLMDDYPLKSEMLRFSIIQNFENLGVNDVIRILSEYFANKFLEQNLTSQTKNDKSLMNIPIVEKKKDKSEERNINTQSQLKLTRDYSFSTHFSETVDIILDTIIKQIQGFLQFRQEFFGVTIYQTIPTGSLEEIKDYLFNQDIPSEEQIKRINLIKEETQKLLTHQLGLLEGYKISIIEGIQLLLHSLNPEGIEKETANRQSSALEKLIPNLKKIKTYETLKQKYRKYLLDPYHIEKKFFRPAFIKGYQKRIYSKGEING